MWTDLDEACTEESNDNSDTVDCQLELKELGNAVVDITTPHDGLDYRREVIIGQYYIRRFLGNISSSNALYTHIEDS